MESLKIYPHYKPSNTPWIGDVPEHWEVKKLKYVALVQPSNVDKKSLEGEESVLLCNYMDVYKNEFVSRKINFMEATATRAEIEKFKIQRGDVLATKDSETPDDIANPALVVDDFENVICAYHLTQIRPYRNELLGEYLFRLFQEYRFKGQFEVGANGVTRFGLSISAFADAYIPLPPLPEQTRIARYLDDKTAQIDHLIAAKQRLLALLREERSGVINRAVTRGLDPTAKMKPSGVPWLGEVPEGWEVKKLKYVIKEDRGAMRTGPFGSHVKNSDFVLSGDYKVYNQRNVLDNDFEKGDDYLESAKFDDLKDFEIFEADVLFTTRGTIGKSAIFPSGQKRGVLHPCLIRVQFDQHKISNEWVLKFVNESSFFIENVSLLSNSTTIEVIYSYNLKEVIIPVPPLPEQTRIVRYLDTKTAEIAATAQKITAEIALLQEYRVALISAAVTGRIRIRD